MQMQQNAAESRAQSSISP